MKQLDKKQKLWLTIGISGAIILIYVGLVIYPQTSDLLDLNQKIYQQQIKLDELDNKQSDLDKLKDKEQEVNYIINQLSAHLTTKEEILDFIVILENIAQKTNNTQEISVAPKSTQPQVKKTESDTNPKETNTNAAANDSIAPPGGQEAKEETLAIQIKLIGSFEGLINYLTELKKTAILNDQTSLDTQLESLATSSSSQRTAANEEQPQGGNISTALNIKIYLKNNANNQSNPQ